MLRCSAIFAAFRTTMPARSCGEVTSTTPLRGIDCITVSEASDVPGGRSTVRVSNSPQMTSSQNCLIAPLTSGPRQMTASSSLGSRRLMDITFIPVELCIGNMPRGLAEGCPCKPNILGMLGPVMSASSTPTLWPSRRRATASRLVTRDLPTPPLPLITATTCLTLLSFWANGDCAC